MSPLTFFNLKLYRSGLQKMETRAKAAWFPCFIFTLLLAVNSSSAQGLIFGGFEIDGNLVTDSGDGIFDWDTVPNREVGIDDPSGQDDDSFNNIKEDTIPDNCDDKNDEFCDPNVEVTMGGIPPNKSDFTRFYVANQNFEGDEYLFLAWERTLDSGSATMDFELNQSNDVYPETSLPVRSEGDLLITYDFGGSGRLTISFREWDGNQWGPEMDLSTSGFAEGTINTEAVIDPFSGQTLTPNTFGELAINLTDSGIIPADECINFGKAYVKSRSSNSFSSSMKDFVFPIDVNIGNCGFTIAKTADTDLSKVGDDVNYTFTVTNTGNPGSPALILDSISDNVLGDLFAEAAAAGLNELSFGESVSFVVPYTVKSSDPDPLINTVTATYKDAGTFSQTDSASHTVNLFQPAITIDLSGDTLSKIGDPVNYTILVNNLSSPDSPPLIGTVTDPFDGLASNFSLEPGQSYEESGTYIVTESDADPFTRTAAVTASPDGFPNILTDSDDHEVNLFQPAVAIDLSGDELSKVGDDINYTITVDNNSSEDSPNLVGTVTDPYDGSVAEIDLAPGTKYVENGSYTVQSSDDDPFTRTASVHVSPEGFPNVLEASEDHTVNLFQPSISVTKTGPDAASVWDEVVYTIQIQNTSSDDTPDLVNPVIEDSLLGILPGVDEALQGGETWTITVARTVELTDPDPLINIVTATFNPDGFPNEITDSDSHTLDVLQPLLQITKTPDGEIIIPGQTAEFTIVVSNVGDGRAIDVMLADTLPTPNSEAGDLTWTVDALPGEEFANGDTFSVNLGDLDAGASVTVIVSAQIPSDYLGAAGEPGGPGTLGSNFEIDGDLVSVPMEDTIDWGDLIEDPDFINEFDLASRQDDNSFGKGSKEDTDPPSVVTGSIPRNKSDLTNFLFYQEVVDGNVFLEVGFIRANTLGTANMDFEFNQTQDISGNGVTPVRTVGDILISFDFASGGNRVELSLREWGGTMWSEAMDLDAVGAAEGAVNDGFSVANPVGGTDPLADKTFGEAVINLTKVFGDDCRSFASAFVKSRSSDSFTSALKDFIAPLFVDIDTCQTICFLNMAAADADNHAPGPVSDDGQICVTNDPDEDPGTDPPL